MQQLLSLGAQRNSMSETKAIIPVGTVQQRILLIRSEKVIVDADLAKFYGVSTRRLNEQVKRNRHRFPEDFMFQLMPEEKAEVIAICDHLSKLKFSKTLPYVFTEHRAIMAASVLNSQRAVEVSVFIVRAFVALRRSISQHKELSNKIAQLERRLVRIIHRSRGASLALRYHSAFASLTNTASIRSVAENTVITNICAIHPLSGELSRLAKHDQNIVAIVQAIKELTSNQSVPKRRQIGFRSDES